MFEPIRSQSKSRRSRGRSQNPPLHHSTVLSFPSIILLLILVIGGLVVSNFVGCKREPEVYKIGAILPLTGSASMLGDFIKSGIDIAVQHINKKGGIKGKKIEIVYEDSKNDPKEGISAFNKLVSMQGLPVIISAMSSVTNAIIPLADRNQTPLFATTVSAAGVTDKSEYVFRLFITADIDAATMARYAANKMKLKKVAVLYVNDDFGMSFKDVFSQTFAEEGRKIVWAESFEKGESNFRGIITKLKSMDFQAVYLLGYEKGLGILVKQLREFGITKPILSIATIAQPYVREQAGDALNNTYFTSTIFNPDSPKSDIARKFISEYETQFGKKPNYFSAFAYDAMFLLSEAIRSHGYTKDGIKKGLLAIKDIQGVMGNITIKSNGDAAFPMIVKKFEGGKIIDAD